VDIFGSGDPISVRVSRFVSGSRSTLKDPSRNSNQRIDGRSRRTPAKNGPMPRNRSNQKAKGIGTNRAVGWVGKSPGGDDFSQDWSPQGAGVDTLRTSSRANARDGPIGRGDPPWIDGTALRSNTDAGDHVEHSPEKRNLCHPRVHRLPLGCLASRLAAARQLQQLGHYPQGRSVDYLGFCFPHSCTKESCI